jgi:hypothetical protein
MASACISVLCFLYFLSAWFESISSVSKCTTTKYIGLGRLEYVNFKNLHM